MNTAGSSSWAAFHATRVSLQEDQLNSMKLLIETQRLLNDLILVKTDPKMLALIQQAKRKKQDHSGSGSCEEGRGKVTLQQQQQQQQKKEVCFMQID